MKLFHSSRTRSARILWLCEELGTSIEVIPASITEPSAELLQINPSRTIPAFVDGDAVITESVAIMLYIASKHGPTPLVVAPQEAGYADFLQFTVLGEAGLLAPLNASIITRFRAPPEQQQNFTVGLITEGYLRRLSLLERQLQKHAYVAADRFTLADISVSIAVGVGADFLGLRDRMPANVLDYHRRMTERPAFQRADAR
jgi:glutathione S-transferase